MTIATFSLPIDIPWQRIALSEDMMDARACDRELPPRWLSSIAIFQYQPPEDQQRTDGFLISYLKVSCTITGYQADGKEIRMRERLGRSGWGKSDLTERLEKTAGDYFACHGAMLEVVVAPHADDRKFPFSDYPYFADFDPKKREMYEVVSESGETMSRSLEDVNVRLGQTTLQSHEVRDSTTLAGELAGAYGNAQTGGQISGKGSASNTSGTTDLTQQTNENIRTTDAAREARETFSHTTQISQMYHQLNSYHLGTNRAAFFVLPRPHVVQSEYTFVRGPRELEGIQEFMLVVVRPKEMETFCVEAYLETAHLTGKPIYSYGESSVQLPLVIDAPVFERDTDDGGSYANPVNGTNSTNKRDGYVIDIGKGLGGYDFSTAGSYGDVDHTQFIVDSDQVTVNGTAIGYWNNNTDTLSPAHLQLAATVYLKRKVPELVGREPGLMITGRAVCSCERRFVLDAVPDRPSVVFEKDLSRTPAPHDRTPGTMSAGDANRLGSELKSELLKSLSSPDRYPRGKVGLLDSQLVAEMLGKYIRHADRAINTLLADTRGVDARLAKRVEAYAPAITRSKILEMPLNEQVERFGLSFDEAVALRRSVSDLAEPNGPPAIPPPVEVVVPNVCGMSLAKARAALAAAGLALGTAVAVDSPWPTGAVVSQEPAAGGRVVTTAAVSLEIASGLSVRVPEVLGARLSEAICRLRDAGLESEPGIEGRPASDARVVGVEPHPGTLITPRSAVSIWLSGTHDKSGKSERKAG